MMGKVPSFSPGSTVSSALPGYVALCLTLQVHRLASAQFTVTGPDHPIAASLGGEAVLPCHLSPRMSAENMEVRWFRYKYSAVVHLYRDGHDQYGQQIPEFRGRTVLLKDDITNGRVSLRIRDIRLSDNGQYKCLFQSSVSYEEALLELQVAGLGSDPVISMEGHQDGGIRVVCRSSGWYPEPEVLWRALQGQLLPSASEKISQEGDDLFQTEIAIVLTEESNQKVSCCVRNPHLNQERESEISIAELFFPRVSPWMVALGVILTLLAVLIPLASYCFGKQHRVKETLQSEMKRQKETLQSEMERQKEILQYEMERQKETLQSEMKRQKEILQSEMKRQKAEYEAVKGPNRVSSPWTCSHTHWFAWSRIGPREPCWLPHKTAVGSELGLTRARSYAVDVTLDPDTAYPKLVLSEDRKRVSLGNKRQDLPNNPERFDPCVCVLGAEGFVGGRRYWEVEVGDKTGWDLGVCRESVSRKGQMTYTPEDGYWVVWLRDGKYKAITSSCTLPVSIRPSRVGIFLDYEAGEVSFYNVTDRSQLFTFTGTFSGTLLPYFSPYLNAGGTNAAPLIICPVPAQAGGNLGP